MVGSLGHELVALANDLLLLIDRLQTKSHDRSSECPTMADGSVYWSIDEWLSAYALLVELGQTRLAVVVDDQYGLDHDV